MYGALYRRGGLDLQSSLAASSAGPIFVTPHHPISCTSELRLYGDGTLECTHTTVKDDIRTQTCIDHSIAILLFEEVYKRFG